MPSNKKWKVGFDPETGSHVSGAHKIIRYEDGKPVRAIMLEKFEFESRLTYARYVPSPAAANFIWVDSENREFTMFASGLDKAIPHIVGGCLSGSFKFVKRGDNTGIEFSV